MECTKQITLEYCYKIDGEKVRNARNEKGWTITRLEFESGVTRKTITEIEKGIKKRVRSSTIDQIATTLGKTFEYFCMQKAEKGDHNEP